MDPINQEINIPPEELKKNWLMKIKEIEARYWLTALIFLADIVILSPVIYDLSSLGMLLFFVLPLTFPVVGLLRQAKWANMYIWFVIIGLIFMDFIALGYSGDFYRGSTIKALLPFISLVIFTIVMIILNIKSTPKVKIDQPNTPIKVQGNWSSSRKYFWFSILILLLVAGFNFFQYYKNIPETNLIETIPNAATNWKNYINAEYGLEFKLPNTWTLNNEFLSTDGFLLTNENKSSLLVLPKGGFNYDPREDPVITDQIIGNKKSVELDWPDVNTRWYFFTDETIPSSWTVCKPDLINCNRLDLKAVTKTDMEIMEQILSTFKFTSSNESKINTDLLPLPTNCKWSEPIATQQDYLSGPDFTRIKLNGYKTVCNPGINLSFYDQKLINLGWQYDVNASSDAPGISTVWGYIKNGKHIIFKTGKSESSIFSD